MERTINWTKIGTIVAIIALIWAIATVIFFENNHVPIVNLVMPDSNKVIVSTIISKDINVSTSSASQNDSSLTISNFQNSTNPSFVVENNTNVDINTRVSYVVTWSTPSNIPYNLSDCSGSFSQTENVFIPAQSNQSINTSRDYGNCWGVIDPSSVKYSQMQNNLDSSLKFIDFSEGYSQSFVVQNTTDSDINAQISYILNLGGGNDPIYCSGSFSRTENIFIPAQGNQSINIPAGKCSGSVDQNSIRYSINK